MGYVSKGVNEAVEFFTRRTFGCLNVIRIIGDETEK